ncbi:hypothetical protein [Fictibacillus barbaricus]|uniref:Uracil-DNA glycosylase-like domain-containing protein n=1 Tax=Fictibacillus barbaricus TaxID=182136 RepID=A0ABU1U5J9_9BACL|nr:hypothetical protein [Fictibacillus barbaricus]MDR7074747.1 hypothetical protein [Fictibacillus barbaricus]
MNKKVITELAQLFNSTGIYSKNRYIENNSPLQVFKTKFPNDSYSYEIDTFLKCQPDFHLGFGADLPWWGNRYFTSENGIRTMILSQDSRSPDGASVTFYMPLLKENKSLLELRNEINSNKSWDAFKSFEKIKNLFDRCKFNFDFVYVTDAQKMDKGWEELLEHEIQIVKPDIILCLGNKGLTYLMKKNNPKITKIVDSENTQLNIHSNALPKMLSKPILIASLFPSTGNGHYTDKRECNVVNTYLKVIKELQNSRAK